MGHRELGFLAIMLVTACCNSAESQPTSVSQGCTTRIGRETVFVGEPRCLAKFPREELSGYWVSGHEHSVFYTARQDFKHAPDSEGYWLHLNDEAQRAVKSKVRGGEWQVFSVKFIGSKSTIPGIYGVGAYKGGILVTRILEIREIAS